MITIRKSPNADSRTADPAAGKEELLESTTSHIADVEEGLRFLAELIKDRGPQHDHTKTEMLDEFYEALKSGHIKDTVWYNHHITAERHHLKSHVPQDVNLIDVIEHIVDCSMAGMARSGEIYDTDIDPNVLQLAVQNTVKLIQMNTRVLDESE
ncbi:MAG: hypothetical protein NC131_10965 [Roseburia sp.]|nr:hypothetical protein [Roseburia sp.]